MSLLLSWQTTMQTLAKWSVEDYHRMIEADILADRRVELIAGEIVEMAPEGPLHKYLTDTAAEYLRSLLQGKAKIYEAHPITLSDSEPEPDIAVVRLPAERYRDRHAYPEDTYWLIEIADSTLTGDLDQKKKAYARAGILEYWVVEVQRQILKVFRQPEGEDYRYEIEYSQGVIFPIAFPKVPVAIEKILGQ
jgi:Uma2 family endonuclease